jgi:hypothetical protein
MTIGMLFEMTFGALGLVEGKFVDATPFRNVSVRWAIDKLIKSGYGVNVSMIDGRTGERMEGDWFIVPCFYQRLKHMVVDKVAKRPRGLRAALTRQPMGGKGGGEAQRFGAMEGQTLLAHGAAFAADDALRVRSDSHRVPICLKCGTIVDDHADTLAALVDARGRGGMCRLCKARTPQAMLDTTYCNVLWQREVAGMGIKVTADMGVHVEDEGPPAQDDDDDDDAMPFIPEDDEEEEEAPTAATSTTAPDEPTHTYSKERMLQMLEFLRSQQAGGTELADTDDMPSDSESTSGLLAAHSHEDDAQSDGDDSDLPDSCSEVSDSCSDGECATLSFAEPGASASLASGGRAPTLPPNAWTGAKDKDGARVSWSDAQPAATARSASAGAGAGAGASEGASAGAAQGTRKSVMPPAKRARVADACDLRRMWGAHAERPGTLQPAASHRVLDADMVSDLTDALEGVTYGDDE